MPQCYTLRELQAGSNHHQQRQHSAHNESRLDSWEKSFLCNQSRKCMLKAAFHRKQNLQLPELKFTPRFYFCKIEYFLCELPTGTEQSGRE